MMAPMDGPALTLDGRVLELDGGVAAYFSHDKESSPSHAAKSVAIDAFHMQQALHVAHEACDAEARITSKEVCSVDEKGIVHGTPESPEDKKETARKMKLFHEKKSVRNRSGSEGQLSVDDIGQVRPVAPRKLSVDDIGQVRLVDEAQEPDDCQFLLDSEGVVHMDGHICVHMDGTSPSLSPKAKCASPQNLKRLHRKRVLRRPSLDNQDMISLDSNGIVRDSWQSSMAPLIMPACAFVC